MAHRRSQRVLLSPAGADTLYNGDSFSDVQFILPLHKKELNTYTTVAFPSAIFPASYFNVEDYQNKIDLLVGADTIQVVVPEGNYTYETYVTAVVPLLPTGMSLDYSISNGLFTMSSDTAFTVLASTTNCLSLGMPKNEDFIAVLTDSKYKAVFPYPANFLGPTKIFVECPSLGIENWNTGSRSRYLGDVTVTASPYELTYFEDASAVEMYFDDGLVDGSSLHVQIKDELGNLLNFRGVAWYLTLVFHTYYPTHPWRQTMPTFLQEFADEANKKRKISAEEQQAVQQAQGQTRQG